MAFSRRVSCAAVLLCMSGWVRGGEPPESFTLGNYIPADVWLYVHEVHNPERAAIDAHWDRVKRALAHSGIDEELKQLLSRKKSDDDRADFEAKWDKARDTFISLFLENPHFEELAIGQRIAFPMPSYIILFRNKPDETASMRRALGDLLDAVSSLRNDLVVTRCERHGARIKSLCVGDMGSVLELVGRGDVTGLAIGRGITDDVLKLMAGERERRSIIDDPTFQKAMRGSESPGDSFAYLRISKIFEQLLGTLGEALRPAKDDPDVHMVRDVLLKAMAHANIFDYVLSVRRTEGLQERHSCVTKLRRGMEDKPLARALVRRTPFKRFDRFVPKNATGFWVSTTIDVALMYDTAVDFIRKEIPNGGPELMARWEALQDSLNFRLDRDVFSWFSGEIVVVTLPGTTSMEANFVVMLRTKDAELAHQNVGRAMDWLSATFEPAMVNPAPAVDAKGFRSVFHPMMMMMRIQPVVGIYKDWLVIGSRAKDVNQCLATARGDAPSISKNRRFQREGVVMGGDLTSVSFSDLSHQGEQLGMLFGMLGMAGGSLPPSEESAPIKHVFKVLSRLAPVFAQVDFQSSSAAVARFTGDGWISKSVVTYKPAMPEAPNDAPTRPIGARLGAE